MEYEGAAKIMADNNSVQMYEKDVEIPTYETGKPDKNPMFLEKRVYQGSSGRVYPLPIIDKIEDKKVMKKWRVVYLENKYLKIAIIPALGGRIQRALDKTNNYDFVYYNHVIKPALVGLAGPWISGGIEFNWPQHHRPSTYSPVEYTLRENKDGSRTVLVSEVDAMFRTKGMAGFTLFPDKAYLEISAQLYNRTDQPQTFLWWANPAYAVNENTQSVFPPDVHAVYDHGRRDVSRFPIATGTYYKMDYSAGVDISRFKNIKVPTSYMAYHSDYDFVGGYDYGKKAGLLHVANHHISPGKKQWTWGCGDFGKAWDRNLTDSDGPYIELMTGVFTDNQPDFSWLNPYEEKSFKQYFMPYKDVGMVKSATIDASVGLEVKEGRAHICVYTTSVFKDAVVELHGKNNLYCSEKVTISPEKTFSADYELESGDIESDLTLIVKDNSGKVLASYTPAPKKYEKIPEAAKPIGAPETLENNEALYLAGLHIEQYRHATYEPDPYYLEGLKRDPSDIRINNAYGALLYRRGRFSESEKYFRRAVEKQQCHNSNPYNGEPLYNLGLSLKMQGRFKEAYDAFYKACWNSAMQDAGYFELSKIDMRNSDWKQAFNHADRSIIRNYHNYKGRNILCAACRKLGYFERAERIAKETAILDPFDFGALNELMLIARETGGSEKADTIRDILEKRMRKAEKNYMELSIDYAQAGMYEEAEEVLRRFISISKNSAKPMAYYYLAWYADKQGKNEEAAKYLDTAASESSDYCFPNRLEDIIVLQNANRKKPNDAKAYYYLGNLWYDRKQYELAAKAWETSAELDSSFPTVHRNLSLYYYNKQGQFSKARAALEKAFSLNRRDARVFLELDQLHKKVGVTPQERLNNFQQNIADVELRDDLYVEYVTLLNLTGKYEKAMQLLLNRKFHPWEGGEGKVTRQYVCASIGIGKGLLKQKKYADAAAVFRQALDYPENLGEGKLAGAQENDVNYYLGCALAEAGADVYAKECFKKASIGLDEPTSAMFYNDQPPEMIFYQGLAMLKLNMPDKAKSKFNKLISYGEKHMFDHVSIDYFAVSLPDFLIFDDDLDRKNTAHCHYLLGLGKLGAGELKDAEIEFERGLEFDPNHQGLIVHKKLLDSQTAGK